MAPPTYIISRVVDPIFAVVIGLGAAGTRISREEKEKGKSKKEWDARKEQLANAQAARQKKRADNIAMRHEKKKGITKKKDGKRRPGFEGKGFGGGGKKKAGAKGKTKK